MLRKIFALLLALLLTIGASAEGIKFSNVTIHDPSVVRMDDGTYYIYGSHMGAAKTSDFIKWKLTSTLNKCHLQPDYATEFAEAMQWAKTGTFWAPDVIQLADGRYYMYYCTCVGDAPLSALGVAVSDSPEGPFENIQVLLKSGEEGYDATRYPNVVDPTVFFDTEGRLWMVYGSYSGGIFILELDPATGLILEGQEPYGKHLVGANHSRIEAPYIMYNPETEYYYLFLSFGGFGSADGYHVRVARSKTPDGPYLDALGQDMANCGGADGTFFDDEAIAPYGVKIIGSWQFDALEGEANQKVVGYRSPGHNSAVYEGETGRFYFVFHTRFADRGETYAVRVHEMYFGEDGWPVLNPMRYAGQPEAEIELSPVGVFKVIEHGRDFAYDPHISVPLTFNADGTITGSQTGSWTETETGIEITLGSETYTGLLVPTYDNQQEQWLPAITALSPSGTSLWCVGATDSE